MDYSPSCCSKPRRRYWLPTFSLLYGSQWVSSGTDIFGG